MIETTIGTGPDTGQAAGLDFAAHGRRPVDARSVLKTAARVERVPWLLRLIAMLPESKGRQGSHPWSAICLLERGA